MDSICRLRQDFASPPSGYGPVPFWFWNGELRTEELLRQVREMKEKGVSGAFLHARHGQLTPYFSDDWFRLVREVVEESARVGFEAWLYDEDNWPSGSAGERVTRDRPELRGHSLKGFSAAVSPTEHVISIPSVRGKLISAMLYPAAKPGRSLDHAKAREVTEELAFLWEPGAESLRLPDLDLEDDAVLFLFWEIVDRYIDPMNPEAARRFLEITHEAYAKVVGEHFGGAVPGIFTDECGLLSIWDVNDSEALPWSPLLAGEFHARRGYALERKLPALLADIGPETTRLRQDFWRTISELYIENFARPIGEWCGAHRLAFTGHVLQEEPLKSQVRIQANTVPFYREMQIPGVDNLTTRTGGLHHRLAAGVCHQMGKARCLSETFGACGWGTPLSHRKPTIDWQLVQGINLFCPHASYYTVFGKRKYENPPSEFVQEPYWPYYKGFADYISRLCYLLTRGRRVARVAVFYPIRSAWAHYHPKGEDPLMEVVEKDLFYLCDLLERLHYDYDLVAEDSLIASTIEDGKLVVGECRYDVLVLPSVPTISRPAWVRATEFFANGGKLMALGLLPTESDRGADEALAVGVMRETMVDAELILRGYLSPETPEDEDSPNFPVTRNHLHGGRLCSFQPSLEKDQAGARGRVHQFLREAFSPDVETAAEEIRCHHRRLEDGNLFFLANITDKPIRTSVKLAAVGAPELWDPETGRVRPLANYTVLDDEGILLLLDFAPHQARVVVVSESVKPHVDGASFHVTGLSLDGDAVEISGWAEKPGRVSAVVDAGGERFNLIGEVCGPPAAIKLSGPWRFKRLQPNALVLPDWQFARLDGTANLSACDSAPWEPLPKREPITWHPKLEPIEIERPEFVTYRTTFGVEELPACASLVLEPIQAPIRVFVNRREVEPRRTGALDPEFLEAEVAGLLRTGVNEVLLVADYRKAVAALPSNLHRITCDLVPEPGRVLGDFALKPAGGERFALVSEPETLMVGSWTEQGYPHYSGTMEYDCEIEIPREAVDCRLVLEIERPADLAELEINGKPAGTRLWGPFRFEIDGLVTAGANAISLKIANTAINALLGKPQHSGLLTTPKIRPYPRVRITQRDQTDWDALQTPREKRVFDVDE